MDGYVLSEEDVAHLDFGPKESIFQKPKATENHLKDLYMKGHINGKPISHMLVDGGAIVNLMPHSLFKKLGDSDDELIKTNMIVSGVGGGEPMGAKGVISKELTIHGTGLTDDHDRSDRFPDKSSSSVSRDKNEVEDWTKPLVDYLHNPTSSVDRKIRR
jgi:hypothetical protein